MISSIGYFLVGFWCLFIEGPSVLKVYFWYGRPAFDLGFTVFLRLVEWRLSWWFSNEIDFAFLLLSLHLGCLITCVIDLICLQDSPLTGDNSG